MALRNNDWAYFQEFWFTSYPFYSPYGQSSIGLNLGWFLVFAIQVWTGVLCLSHRYKIVWLLRGWEATAIVASTFFASIAGVYQLIVQHDIFYESIGNYRASFHPGFWIALASLVLLIISYQKSLEREQAKKLFSHIRHSWKLSLAIILILTSLFLLVNESQFQTHVTKNMIIEKRGLPKPADPKLWESDLKTITTIAGLFRARLTHNSPEYLYCELEVPVISYRLLMAIYNSIGFIAREPTFVTLL